MVCGCAGVVDCSGKSSGTSNTGLHSRPSVSAVEPCRQRCRAVRSCRHNAQHVMQQYVRKQERNKKSCPGSLCLPLCSSLSHAHPPFHALAIPLVVHVFLSYSHAHIYFLFWLFLSLASSLPPAHCCFPRTLTKSTLLCAAPCKAPLVDGGAIEAVVAAMTSAADDAGIQEACAGTLRNFAFGNGTGQTRVPSWCRFRHCITRSGPIDVASLTGVLCLR